MFPVEQCPGSMCMTMRGGYLVLGVFWVLLVAHQLHEECFLCVKMRSGASVADILNLSYFSWDGNTLSCAYTAPYNTDVSQTLLSLKHRIYLFTEMLLLLDQSVTSLLTVHGITQQFRLVRKRPKKCCLTVVWRTPERTVLLWDVTMARLSVWAKCIVV